MTGWRQADFSEVVHSRGSGTSGLPQSEWATDGEFPVIGQGSDYVEGWTDRADLVVTPDPAVVLYGGHTRRAKLVDRPFVPGPNVRILAPVSDLNAAFLFRYLEQLQVESRGYADHFPEVRRRSVPLPPLAEQKRIAAILDAADALRAKRREALAQLDSLLQATFLEMFGDPVTNPMGWERLALDSFCRPKQWPTIGKNELLPQGYPVFGANGQIGYYSSYNHLNETVLITCRGATCGTINVCPPMSYVTGNAMALDDLNTDRVHLRFLQHALARTDFRPVITGVAQPQITRQSLQQLSVPVPPIALQSRFAAIVESVELQRTSQGAHLAESDTLFASLQARAFRGEL